MKWIIQAQRLHLEKLWTRTEQIPTFVLPECLGLMSEEYARKVALEILGVTENQCSMIVIKEDV